MSFQDVDDLIWEYEPLKWCTHHSSDYSFVIVTLIWVKHDLFVLCDKLFLFFYRLSQRLKKFESNVKKLREVLKKKKRGWDVIWKEKRNNEI